MHRVKVLIFVALAFAILAGAAFAYEFFVGFPRTFEGQRVHRVTVWSAEHRFERERMYYAYTRPDGYEAKHGLFENFQDGRLIQQISYRDGKLDGTITFWNQLGQRRKSCIIAQARLT